MHCLNERRQKQKKWKEAGFQMMNIGIPMLMVSGALEICDRIKVCFGTARPGPGADVFFYERFGFL